MYTINEEEYQILQQALAFNEAQRKAAQARAEAEELRKQRITKRYNTLVEDSDFCGIAVYWLDGYNRTRLSEALRFDQPMCIIPFNGQIPTKENFVGLRYTTDPAIYTNVLSIQTMAKLEDYQKRGFRFPDSFVEDVRVYEENERKAMLKREKERLLQRRDKILPKLRSLQEELNTINYDLSQLK